MDTRMLFLGIAMSSTSLAAGDTTHESMWMIALLSLVGVIIVASLWTCAHSGAHNPNALRSSSVIESPIEKAMHLVASVREDLEENQLCSILPICGQYMSLARHAKALSEVELLLRDPLPLHMPEILQEIHSGNLSADKDTEAWLLYELANRESCIDTWSVNRQIQQRQNEIISGRRPSRSQSIISMRDTRQTSVTHLDNIDSWDFNVFELVDLGKEEFPLAAVGFCLFMKHDLFRKLSLDMDKVESLMAAIDVSYAANPYHCNLHGAEVASTISFMLTKSGFYHRLDATDIAAMLLAALSHDIAHPGQTNQFHIATESDLALRYNNQSVLENYHAAFVRKLLRKPGNEIFDQLDRGRVRAIEELLIAVILATDMSTNFEHCAKFRRAQISATPFPAKRMSINRTVPEQFADAGSLLAHKESFFTIMEMSIKCADVSHCAKDWNIHKRFSDMIQAEFFCQGDKERALNIPIAPYMDRTTMSNSAKNQQGFFQFLVMPVWNTWTSLCPIPQADFHILKNMKEWEARASAWVPISQVEVPTRSPVGAGAVTEPQNITKTLSRQPSTIHHIVDIPKAPIMPNT